MSTYVYNTSLSYPDYLQAKSFVGDLKDGQRQVQLAVSRGKRLDAILDYDPTSLEELEQQKAQLVKLAEAAQEARVFAAEWHLLANQIAVQNHGLNLVEGVVKGLIGGFAAFFFGAILFLGFFELNRSGSIGKVVGLAASIVAGLLVLVAFIKSDIPRKNPPRG